MHWMNDWPTPFPVVVDRARGATILDIDGISLDDFCLGDTGSMFGHSPPPVARAIRRQAGRGLTYMLPDEDALVLGRLLSERFGLPEWQIATTATDANRFALRVARAVTGRPKILVFNGCYHGSVDETMVRLVNGRAVNRPGLAGEFRDLTENTKVVEFNDIPALEKALAAQDVACVITEPVLTNCCMVLPEPGFHDALRRLTREDGHAAADRRDAHHLDRSGRLYEAFRPRARSLRARQADRRRRAGERLGHERAKSPSATAPTMRQRYQAIPAWARRCRPIRCSSPRCARRSKR